jgi:hypothetical protein
MAYQVKGNFIDRIYNTVVPFAANAAINFQLSVTSIVSELQFRLTGTLTNAAYSTAPVKRVESIENLISQLRITGNGKVTGAQSDAFNSTDAAFLAYKTRIMETTAPYRVDVGTTNAAYPFVSTFKRYFGAKRSGSASFFQSCFLDSRNLSTFNAAFQWRDVGAMIDPTTGVGGTSVLSNVQCTILSREYQGGPPTSNAPYVKESQRSFDLTNLAGLNVPFKNAPVGGWMPRQTFKTTVGDQPYCDPSDAVIATTQKAEGAHMQSQQDGRYLWMDTTYLQQRDVDKTLYNVETLPTGYCTLEYPGGLNLASAQTLDNILDLTVTGGSTNTLQITDEQVIFAKAA